MEYSDRERELIQALEAASKQKGRPLRVLLTGTAVYDPQLIVLLDQAGVEIDYYYGDKVIDENGN